MSTLPLLALLANTAFGYSVKTDDAGNELYWATTPITISLNTEGMADVSDDAAYEALENAAGDFDEAEGSELHFVVDGQPGPQAVPVRAGIDLGDDPLQAQRTRRVQRHPLGQEGALAGSRREPAKIVHKPVEILPGVVKEAGRQQQAADQIGRRRFHAVDTAASTRRRFELGGCDQHGQGAAGEPPFVPEPAVGHPFDRNLLPGQGERTGLGLREDVRHLPRVGGRQHNCGRSLVEGWQMKVERRQRGKRRLRVRRDDRRGGEGGEGVRARRRRRLELRLHLGAMDCAAVMFLMTVMA